MIPIFMLIASLRRTTGSSLGSCPAPPRWSLSELPWSSPAARSWGIIVVGRLANFPQVQHMHDGFGGFEAQEVLERKLLQYWEIRT
jgi:hypothetical protein